MSAKRLSSIDTNALSHVHIVFQKCMLRTHDLALSLLLSMTVAPSLLVCLMIAWRGIALPKSDIHGHHDDETNDDAKSGQFLVATLIRFRDEIVDDDKDHRTRGKRERVRENRLHVKHGASTNYLDI